MPHKVPTPLRVRACSGLSECWEALWALRDEAWLAASYSCGGLSMPFDGFCAVTWDGSLVLGDIPPAEHEEAYYAQLIATR